MDEYINRRTDKHTAKNIQASMDTKLRKSDMLVTILTRRKKMNLFN